MPWKGEKDPYKIWLSEIILQQTRVDQGLNYYHRFIETFPDIHRLAAAPDEKVYKLWEGLGYYTRCRNLIATARYISKELKGRFPDNYEDIKKLKGIGPYTAAAISSFAFNEPHAVVDGNVYRVLSRIFGIDKPTDSTEGKKYFNQLANELLDKEQPGKYNKAIMDFGAVICKPSPLCDECPFQPHCFAYLNDKIQSLPVKAKKTKVQKRWFYYLVPQYKGNYMIRQRKEKDIWFDLFEFLLIETEQESDIKKILKDAEKKGWLQKSKYSVKAVSGEFSQQLTHQFIKGQFIEIKLTLKPAELKHQLWVTETSLDSYAFPRFINQFLQRKIENGK